MNKTRILKDFLPAPDLSERLEEQLRSEQPILIVGPERMQNLSFLRTSLISRPRAGLKMLAALESDRFERPEGVPGPDPSQDEGLAIMDVAEPRQCAEALRVFLHRDASSISSTHLDRDSAIVMAATAGTGKLRSGAFVLDATEAESALMQIESWLAGEDPRALALWADWILWVEIQPLDGSGRVSRAGTLACSDRGHLSLETWITRSSKGYQETGSLKPFLWGSS